MRLTNLAKLATISAVAVGLLGSGVASASSGQGWQRNSNQNWAPRYSNGQQYKSFLDSNVRIGRINQYQEYLLIIEFNNTQGQWNNIKNCRDRNQQYNWAQQCRHNEDSWAQQHGISPDYVY